MHALKFFLLYCSSQAHRRSSGVAAFVLIFFWISHANGQLDAKRYYETILPILQASCFDCHSGDTKEGGVQFDSERPEELLKDKTLWLKVLRNVRSDMMPPRDSEQPTAASKLALVEWIHSEVFEFKTEDPFPGVAPIRRLNRSEYRNTIRDLTGIDFNAEVVFPPDDTGFGFDNVSEAMSMSPMLIEKYFQAAKSIVEEAVPKSTWIMASSKWKGTEFLSSDGSKNGTSMRHDQPLTVQKSFEIKHPDEYCIVVREKLDGSFDFHPGRYQITCLLDGKKLYSADHKWEEDKFVDNDFKMTLAPGSHAVDIEISTLTSDDEKMTELKDRFVSYEIVSLTVDGPMDESHWEHPKGYKQFFDRESPPADLAGRREYAYEILSRFAARSYRRPASPISCERLVTIAESIYQQPGMTFESGIEKAFMAILASPQFLFRVEDVETLDEKSQYPNVDEYALATRLSYLLWSTMPDEELFSLAEKGELRKNLQAQVQRMVQDKRSYEFVENFAGQWLRACGVENVSIDLIAAMGFQKEYASLRASFGGRGRRTKQEEVADDPETVNRIARYRELGALRDRFDASIRSAMRKETEMSFDFIVRQDRSLLDLIDADYVFVNEKLASLYELEGIH